MENKELSRDVVFELKEVYRLRLEIIRIEREIRAWTSISIALFTIAVMQLAFVILY